MINKTKQKGFSIVVAIFILVILGVGAAFVVNVAIMSKITTDFAVLGRRAYFAAVSGAEWGLHQAVVNGSCAASSSFNLTQASLSGYSVTVTCTQQSYTEGITTYQVFNIASTANRGTFGDTDYASRTVEVKATRGV